MVLLQSACCFFFSTIQRFDKLDIWEASAAGAGAGDAKRKASPDGGKSKKAKK
jgi:hypothetical protein